MAAPTAEKKRGGSSFLKILLAVVVALILLVGVLAVIFFVVLSQDEEDGITRAQFDSISLGTIQQEVENQFGDPENSQEFESQIPEIQDQPARGSCIYYPEKGEPILEGDSYQLCFANGVLTSKNVYSEEAPISP